VKPEQGAQSDGSATFGTITFKIKGMTAMPVVFECVADPDVVESLIHNSVKAFRM